MSLNLGRDGGRLESAMRAAIMTLVWDAGGGGPCKGRRGEGKSKTRSDGDGRREVLSLGLDQSDMSDSAERFKRVALSEGRQPRERFKRAASSEGMHPRQYF
ncbi:hypothetical protein PMIN07_011588 [Paraphaeosphaeria minitans]